MEVMFPSIEQLEELFREFTELGTWKDKAVFKKDLFLRYIREVISDPDSVLIAVGIEGELAGVVVATRGYKWFDLPTGNIQEFYVREKFRKTHVARQLVDKATEWFDEFNCYESYTSTMGGTGTEKLFINLMRKFGYLQDAGGGLTRRKGKHE